MKRLLTVFDYVFVRLYRFWLAEADPVPETKAHLILSLMQFFTILNAEIVLILLTDKDTLISKPVMVSVVVGIGLLNYFRYEHTFDAADWEDRWSNEPEPVRIRKGWLIGIYLLMSMAGPVAFGLLRHNLHWI